MLRNIHQNENGAVFLKDIIKQYKTETASRLSAATIARLIHKLFPSVVRTYKWMSQNGKGHERVNMYEGISFNTLCTDSIQPVTFSNISKYLSEGMFIMSKTDDLVTIGIDTGIRVNGNMVLKELTINTEGKNWRLQVSGSDIVLNNMGIDRNFQELTIRELKVILQIVDTLKVCTGLQHAKLKASIPDHFFREYINVAGTNEAKLRSRQCKRILSWLCYGEACDKCKKYVRDFINSLDSDMDKMCSSDDSDLSKILEVVYEKAPTEMKKFLKAQFENLFIEDSHQRRWDTDIIKCCLNLWTRSPRSYKDLKDSQMLILPSGRQLQRYKNAVSQNSGINEDVFQWMKKVADDNNVPSCGRSGGLIHDETRIQQSIMFNTKGKQNTLVGWIDTGEESRDIEIAKTKSVQQVIASEVFQVSFLGYTGFRFPLAHYPTKGISASEIYIIIYDIISTLQSWGFQVDFVLQDGGQANREFIKMHFGNDKEASKQNYCSTNIVNLNDKLAHSQDFSHNMKKLRNAVMSSGIQKSSKREIKKNSKPIMWQQWVEAARWDEETNSRKIHYKLTPSHLQPDSAEKMRNHLAEEVLDSDMLNLMKQYRMYLKDGEILDSSIEFLEQTSNLINIFRDRRPIISVGDSRLKSLKCIRAWFLNWREEIAALDVSAKAKEKSLPSKKCLDDMDCLISTFVYVVTKHLKKFPGTGVYPSRFNSDIIENNFCQVRGLHNGNMTNPTYLQYQNTMNSVILGQSSISSGKKSNAGQPVTNPYYVKAPKERKRKALSDISNTVYSQKPTCKQKYVQS